MNESHKAKPYPRFSFIIPVYNTERFLAQCLDSIIGQSYKEFEVLIVDDGSTDTSGKIADHYAAQDERITVVHNQNKGALLSRVQAIHMAQSDYCIFVDADDFVSPKMLDVLTEEIRQYPHDIFLYERTLTDIRGNPLKEIKGPFPKNTVFSGGDKHDMYVQLFENTYLNSLWTKAIKTSLLQQDPTDYTQYRTIFDCEDLLHSLFPLTYAQSVKFLGVSLYYYRFSLQSASRDINPQIIENHCIVHQAILSMIPLWDNGHEDQYMALFRKGYVLHLCKRLAKAVKVAGGFATFRREFVLPVLNDTQFSQYLPLVRKENAIPLRKRAQLFLLSHHMFRTFFCFHKLRIGFHHRLACGKMVLTQHLFP